MTEIIRTILNFIGEITFKDIIGLLFKTIILCNIYVFICEGIDAIKWVIKCFTIAKYNYYTTKFQERVEERVCVPYVRKSVQASSTIDISNIIEVLPKLVINIDIMTGKIQRKEVWKKRGICEKIIHPLDRGIAKSIRTEEKMEKVEKKFIYTQALANTLNLNYLNWQELNPDLSNELSKEKIIAEEVIILYLRNFKK